MGGLLARIYLTHYRPPSLARVVMLGTPNGGSEVADFLKGLALYRAFYGPAGQQVGTRLKDRLAQLSPPDYAVGIVAGNRTIDPVASYFIVPRPNDGRVSVESTRLKGMTDHIVVNATHSGLFESPRRDQANDRLSARQQVRTSDSDVDAKRSNRALSPANCAALLKMICPTAQAFSSHTPDVAATS